MKEIIVSGVNDYSVVVGKNLRTLLIEQILEHHKVVIFYAPAIKDYVIELVASTELANHQVFTLQLEDSEDAKSFEQFKLCHDFLGNQGLSRSDLIIGIGGGATTDIVGFVAGTWLRGVRVIQAPTTLLGMVDAAVGGKTGINSSFGKNLIGVFHDPHKVICDLNFLVSQSNQDLASGMAEIIKCGLISDESIISTVLKDRSRLFEPNHPNLVNLVISAIQVKAKFVEMDRLEESSDSVGRAALNYGHTLGHAIENVENYSWRHGDAIAVGMVFAAAMALELKFLTHEEFNLHLELFESMFLPVVYKGATLDNLIKVMLNDKKSRSGTLRFVLLEGLQNPVFVEDLDREILEKAFVRIAK